jgi:23S rRNA A1618 N6-methylase RlmF
MDVIWATPLYEFLRQCNASQLRKTILDCGAGGSQPPLSLFYQYGYQTFGIEIAAQPLEEAQRFCADNNMPLGIIRGDMRCIPFPNN